MVALVVDKLVCGAWGTTSDKYRLPCMAVRCFGFDFHINTGIISTVLLDCFQVFQLKFKVSYFVIPKAIEESCLSAEAFHLRPSLSFICLALNAVLEHGPFG